jgi:hypothetical protein
MNLEREAHMLEIFYFMESVMVGEGRKNLPTDLPF